MGWGAHELNNDPGVRFHHGALRQRRQAGFDGGGECSYDEQVGFSGPALCRGRSRYGRKTSLAFRLLPLRSTVGQLPLEQHIGVRIPEGQPNRLESGFCCIELIFPQG